MRSLILAMLCFGLLAARGQVGSVEKGQSQKQEKSAINMEALEGEPEAQELNTAPTPTPDADSESEKFPGTLSTGQSYRLGPYDKEGNYIQKQPPEIEEAQQELESQQEKQEELERIHDDELLDYSTTPERDMVPPAEVQER